VVDSLLPHQPGPGQILHRLQGVTPSLARAVGIAARRLTGYAFKPHPGEDPRPVGAALPVRAGEIKHGGNSLSLPRRLFAQGGPELGWAVREQASQVLSDQLRNLRSESIHVQLDSDASGLVRDRVHDRHLQVLYRQLYISPQRRSGA
jgi:hypothetical protein